MKTLIYITFKYWKKHIKNALAMLFSGILLSAIIFVTLMSERENYVKKCHSGFDARGHYDVLIANSDDEILAKAVEGKNGYKHGVIYVYGMLGDGKTRFAYGTIEDEHNLCHIPLDDGRMPETKDEIIADRGALDALFWTGKCGDTITLDGKTFTVTGIINEKYGQYREGSQLFKKLSSGYEPDNKGICIPLIFVGESNEQPLYRIDMLGNIFNMYLDKDSIYREAAGYLDNLYDFCDIETQWLDINYDGEMIVRFTDPMPFFMYIAWLGAAISALSVFSVLRNVFAERKGRIEILKRLGMSKSKVTAMLGIECALFAAADVILGIAAGVAVYEGIFAFKTNVLGEAPYSGFTDLVFVRRNTLDPFLFAGIISAAIIVGAYVLNALISNIKLSVQKKNAEPRPLSKCFTRAFGERTITITQTAALTLICFSVLMGYMYYTDNGKTHADKTAYTPPSVYYNANNLNMETYGIAEYYSCSAPVVSGIGDKVQFSFVNSDYSKGIDDNIAAKLPEYALASGNLTHTFIAVEKPNNFLKNEIDTSSEDIRNGLLALSSEEYQSFFEDGQIGSMHLYRVDTKLAPARTITSLSENVVEGEINIDAINSGKEIIVAYQGVKPNFKAGETVLLNSAAATETGYGIGKLISEEVKIGALLRIPENGDKVKNSTVRNDEEYNFLTTAAGASAIGLHCARYTEIYTLEPMDGGIIPSSAEMKLMSLEALKHDDFVKKLIQYSSSILILLVMSLLGFAAYFNGIGMKIRLKSYNISVMRAIGAPISELRKRLLLNSIKIPLLSSVIAYVMVKLAQLEMIIAHSIYVSIFDKLHGNGFVTNGSPDYKPPLSETIQKNIMSFLDDNFFIDAVMWQANAEIPALILLAVLLAVTFLLTIIALRKFKSNIAGDLNEGRTRQ